MTPIQLRTRLESHLGHIDVSTYSPETRAAESSSFSLFLVSLFFFSFQFCTLLFSNLCDHRPVAFITLLFKRYIQELALKSLPTIEENGTSWHCPLRTWGLFLKFSGVSFGPCPVGLYRYSSDGTGLENQAMSTPVGWSFV